jgi:hypothetical protein
MLFLHLEIYIFADNEKNELHIICAVAMHSCFEQRTHDM